MSTSSTIETREARILNRAIKPRKNTLAPAAAKALLQLQLDERDLARLHELAQKNQNEMLTPEEKMDLQSYLNVGMLLDLLQAKARLAVKKTTSSR